MLGSLKSPSTLPTETELVNQLQAVSLDSTPTPLSSTSPSSSSSQTESLSISDFPLAWTDFFEKENEANFGYLVIPNLPSDIEVTSLTGLPSLAGLSFFQISLTSEFCSIDQVDPLEYPLISRYQATLGPSFSSTHEPLSSSASSSSSSSSPSSTFVGSPVLGHVHSKTLLTSLKANAPVYELQIEVPSHFNAWEPGDSFGLYTPTPWVIAVATFLALQGHPLHGLDPSSTGTCSPFPPPWSSRVGQFHTVVPMTSTSKRVRHPTYPFPMTHVPQRWRVLDFLRTQVDLMKFPKRTLFRALAQWTSDGWSKKVLMYLSSQQGQLDYRYLESKNYTLLHVLASVPSFHLSNEDDLTLFISLLPPLAPRYYSQTTIYKKKKTNFMSLDSPLYLRAVMQWVPSSIPGTSSSSSSTSSTFRSVLSKWGHCTQYMMDAKVQAPVIVVAHPTLLFHVPSSVSPTSVSPTSDTTPMTTPPPSSPPSIPMVLIGTGTGIAPYLSFMEHMENLPSSSPSPSYHLSLYQGCRYLDGDALYRSTFESYQQHTSFLKKYTLAVSRSPSEPRSQDPMNPDGSVFQPPSCTEEETTNKLHLESVVPKYVQEALLRDQAELIQKVCDQGGYLYVCGDVAKLGKPFQVFLNHLFETATGDPAYITTLIKQKRYRQELW
ncbi:hypothetical protein HMI54_009583 [Coelomomyces lativittatus]|nr:hypothetical protein HMI54_009583 [Coelomomyces lativittatus]KAJ1506723.1 hypothetical protein HMI55_001058 [Coelomomyces lativittatus]KAJ1507678.1 hypothetical protein HMI56_007666 [Coelomomyces lativittatus]